MHRLLLLLEALTRFKVRRFSETEPITSFPENRRIEGTYKIKW